MGKRHPVPSLSKRRRCRPCLRWRESSLLRNSRHRGVSCRGDERGRTSCPPPGKLGQRHPRPVVPMSSLPSLRHRSGIPPSFRHPSRHSGIPPVVPASLPSFRHPSRRSVIPPVVPASLPSFRHPSRRSGIPPVIPASLPSFRHPPVIPASPRHSGIPSVIPASPPSFRHPPRHSGESRNPRSRPSVCTLASWRKGTLDGGIC